MLERCAICDAPCMCSVPVTYWPDFDARPIECELCEECEALLRLGDRRQMNLFELRLLMRE